MRWFTRHPGDRELNRFADGDLDERELARINAHLARCPRCREEVGLVRRMGRSAASLPAPIARDEVLRRALARRSAGERVLLPTSDAGAPRLKPATRFAPAAVAALLTLMIASLVVSVRVLEADRPALRLLPERPEAGEALSVEYHGGALFADQTHLKLRARYRTAEDRHWQLLAGILVRGDDGLYRTEVQLPDSVVYAAFAVEDLHGERLDSNNRELWDVMVHGDDGRPTLDAMTGRLRDLQRRDWGGAYQQSIRLTEVYPEAPQSWAARYAFELSLFNPDSVAQVHRHQFDRLEGIVANSPRASARDKAWLGLYALTLGELESGEIWVERAAEQAPYAHSTLQAQMMLWAHQSTADPAVIHEQVNALWSALPVASEVVANLGWQVALEADDLMSAQVWFSRYLSLRPEEALVMAPRVYRMGERVRAVRDWIETEVAATEVERPLHLTEEQHERVEAAQRQRLLSSMAEAAYRSGDPERAVAIAEAAVDLSWESPSLLTLGRILIDTGRRDAAELALARAAVDPRTATRAASLASNASIEGFDFRDRIRDSERQLRRHVMDGAVTRHINTGIRLAGANGSVRLADLLADRVSVLTFVSRLCGPALQELPRIAELSRELSAIGAQLIVINVDGGNQVENILHGMNSPVTVVSDITGEARAELLSSFTPDYFVLDHSGRVRFEHSRVDEVLRQAQTIQHDLASAIVAAN